MHAIMDRVDLQEAILNKSKVVGQMFFQDKRGIVTVGKAVKSWA